MLAIVAPLAGAWIEIFVKYTSTRLSTVSLPSRERGLKFVESNSYCYKSSVAPLAGAWIEITDDDGKLTGNMSLPSRERGLKSPDGTPLQRNLCRSPRGSVD